MAVLTACVAGLEKEAREKQIIEAIIDALHSRDYKDGLLHIADILHVELPPFAYRDDQPTMQHTRYVPEIPRLETK
jgi:hypothetical protein